jgi:hypothetical protein
LVKIMASATEILNSPDYVNANQATKEAIFEKHVANDTNFKNASPETQDAIRQRFGIAVAPQEGMPTRAMDYARQTISNVPGDVSNIVGGLAHAVANPSEVASGLYNLGKGVSAKMALAMVKPEDIKNPQAYAEAQAAAKPAEAMGQQIYQAVTNPAETFKNAPVSTLLNVAPMLRGAGAVTEAANLSRFGELPLTIGGQVKDITGAQVLNAAARNPENLISFGAPYAINKGLNGLNTLGQTASTVGAYIDPMTGAAKVASAVPNALASTYGYARDILNPKNMAYLSSLEGRGQDVVNALRNAQEIVPGSAPTSAQAASDVSGTLYPALEQDILGRRPNITAAAERQAQNEAARRAAVGEVAQTPEELQNAVKERTKITEPMYEQAKADTRMAAGRKDLNGVLQDIIKSNKANPPLVSMMEDIQNNVSTNVKQVRDVSSALDHVEGLLNSTNDPFVKSQLLKVKDKMMSMIPGMKAADEAFAAASKPVNTMQVGQELAGKLTPFEGSVEQGPAFQRAMANPAETFESATGRKMIGNLSDAIGPEATAKLEAVRQDIARQAKTEQLAAQGAEGGDALKKATNIPHFTPLDRLWNIASKILEVTKGHITEATAKEMAAEFLKPELGANAIEKAMQYERARNAAQAAIVNRTNQLGAVMRPSLYASNVLSPILNRNALAGQ